MIHQQLLLVSFQVRRPHFPCLYRVQQQFNAGRLGNQGIHDVAAKLRSRFFMGGGLLDVFYYLILQLASELLGAYSVLRKPERAAHLRPGGRLYTCFFRTDQMNPSYQKCMIAMTMIRLYAASLVPSIISAQNP